MISVINTTSLETYGKCWSEESATDRMELMAICLSADCVYTDPNVKLTGHAALSDYMAELQKNIPGVAFVATDLKFHHDRCLMHWNMVNGTGNVLSPGASYFLFGADGRLVQMNGFFDA